MASSAGTGRSRISRRKRAGAKPKARRLGRTLGDVKAARAEVDPGHPKGRELLGWVRLGGRHIMTYTRGARGFPPAMSFAAVPSLPSRAPAPPTLEESDMTARYRRQA